MTGEVTNIVVEALPQFEGYVFPNEASLHPVWSTLIVIYPYITGLVAGAFIMASLVRVFNVKALAPVYRLSMLTALAFLLCATLPLLCHLGHPEFLGCLGTHLGCVSVDGLPAAEDQIHIAQLADRKRQGVAGGQRVGARERSVGE